MTKRSVVMSAAAFVIAYACVTVAQEPSSARGMVAAAIKPAQWEYSTVILYNWVPEAYQSASAEALASTHILNVQPKLAEMAKTGWELVAITSVPGWPGAKDLRVRSERFVLVLKKAVPAK